MLWSWKKDDAEVLSAEMSDLTVKESRAAPLEEERGAGESTGAAAVTVNGGTDSTEGESTIDQTGTYSSTFVGLKIALVVQKKSKPPHGNTTIQLCLSNWLTETLLFARVGIPVGLPAEAG